MLDLRELPVVSQEAPEVERWAIERFDRALLVLGDRTEPLRPLTRCWIAREGPSGAIQGLAVRFEGFGVPTVSLVADRPDAIDALVACACGGRGLWIAVHADQPLPARLATSRSTADPWMTAPCASEPAALAGVEPLGEAGEVQELCRRLGLRFWAPAMLRFGHAFGARGPGGELVAMGGVNFVLPRRGYAQIGALATHPDHRGQGLGARLLRAIRHSLAGAGIATAGLLADGADPGLPEYYARQGFTRSGLFRFVWSEPGTSPGEGTHGGG